MTIAITCNVIDRQDGRSMRIVIVLTAAFVISRDDWARDHLNVGEIPKNCKSVLAMIPMESHTLTSQRHWYLTDEQREIEEQIFLTLRTR